MIRIVMMLCFFLLPGDDGGGVQQSVRLGCNMVGREMVVGSCPSRLVIIKVLGCFFFLD